MALILLMVLASLVSAGSAFSSVSCENLHANCSCPGSDYNKSFQDQEILCPQFDLTVKFREKNLQFQCKPTSALTSISGLKVIGNDTFAATFWFCPLPDTSYREFISNLGVNKLSRLQIQSYSNYGSSLQKKYFKGLHEVSKLLITNNELTILPSDLFEDMGNLTWLDMKQNKLQLPKEIFQFTPKIEVLELGSNNMSYLPPGIFKNLDKLRLLNLWGNKLKNLTRAVFSDIPNLESLDLNSNEMETIRPDLFSDLVMLKKLNLYANTFLSLPQGLLSRNTELEEFQMHENRRSMSLPPGFLSNLEKLKTVRLSGCKMVFIPEDTFSGSKNIQMLFLSRNSLTTLPEKIFIDLENLTDLDLSQNSIDHLPEGLFLKTNHLKNLKLQYNQLMEIPLNLFPPTLEHLEYLDLRFNKIKGVDGSQFENLVGLKSLNISDNQLTAFSSPGQMNGFGNYSVLHKCTGLEDVQLANNSLTEIYADFRLVHTHLRIVNLAFNQISHLDINDLDFLASRVSIDLSSNKISTANFWNARIYALDHLNNFKTSYERDANSKRISVNLDNNPFNCNCLLLPFTQFLRGQLTPEVQYLFNIPNNNLRCSEPPNLEKIPLSKVPHQLLTCEMKNQSAQEPGGPYFCPEGCSCAYRPYDKANLINCQSAGFTQLPPLISTYSASNHSELIMEDNRLKSFSLPEVKAYKNVTHFNLSRNNITHVNITGVSPKIQELDLSFNNLSRLGEDTVSFLENAAELRSLEIQNNGWMCDCEAKPFIRLIKNRYTLVKRIQNVTCADGSVLEKLEESELCSNQASLIIFTCIILAVLSFLIALLTTLYYRYRTQIHIYCFNSKWQLLRWMVSHPDIDEDKKYDAFISYAHQDEQFVVEHLMPHLEEKGDTKYKLCVHFRDFIPGETIPNQILHAVQSSRRTIVVLSPSFLASVWGTTEFRTAHYEALKEGTSRVIVILYQDVGSVTDLDEDLKAYLQMNTYLQWGSPWFWQQLHYALPHPPENADDVSCVFGCLPRISRDSSNHEVLGNVQLKNGEVTYNMSNISDKVNGQDSKNTSATPLIIETMNEKPKEVENHKNGKVAAV